MKATQRSSSRRRSPTGPGISLFPFLAVLICTMGALVPLLLAITRTARLQAETAALAKAAEQGAELKTQQEDVRWRIEQLKKSRGRAEKRVADARLELGHIEDHSRRIRGQLAQYQRTISDIQGAKATGQEQIGQSQAELEQVRNEITVAQQQLADASKAAAGKNRCYAVVPYEGPNQTHRRPIYLECRADAVVLQPEGIELTEGDFEGPLGPGNPLAATLRATREYVLADRQFDPQIGDPYPMLLVRPEGIAAYYAARAAMKSWGFDFGYELVDGEWKLAFPPPDPRLAEVVRQVVASARASQARLAAAAPRHYGSGTTTTYRAAPGGGFVREAVRGDGDDREYARAATSGAVGADGGYGGGGSAVGATASGGGGGYGSGAPAAGPTGSGGSGGYAGDGPAFEALGSGGPASYGGNGPAAAGGGAGTGTYGSLASQSGGTSSGTAAGGIGGPSQQGPGGTMASSTSPRATTTRPSPGAATSSERPDGYVVGEPARERVVSNQPAPSESTSRGRVLLPGEWQPAPERPVPRREDKDEKSRGKHGKSLAQERGIDWGLRDANRSAIGVTRPIRVDCYADRLIVVSDRGPSANKVIMLGPRTETAVDPLISAVWEQIEAWGMAGRGMYWRPLLQLHVAADAEPRFAELASLLDGSGITIERK